MPKKTSKIPPEAEAFEQMLAYLADTLPPTLVEREELSFSAVQGERDPIKAVRIAPWVPPAVLRALRQLTADQLDAGVRVEPGRVLRIMQAVVQQARKFLAEVDGYTASAGGIWSATFDAILCDLADCGDWATLAHLLDEVEIPCVDDEDEGLRPSPQTIHLWRIAAAFQLRRYGDVPKLLGVARDTWGLELPFIAGVAGLIADPLLNLEQANALVEWHAEQAGPDSLSSLLDLHEEAHAEFDSPPAVLLSSLCEMDAMDEAAIYAVIQSVPLIHHAYLLEFEERTRDDEDEEEEEEEIEFDFVASGGVEEALSRLVGVPAEPRDPGMATRGRVPPTIWRPRPR